MNSLRLRRIRSITAGVVALGLVVGVLVFAVLSDGRVGSVAVTNDGGAWLLNRKGKSIGHVNRVVGEVAQSAGPFIGAFDVEQSDGVLVVSDRGNSQVVLVDPTVAEKAAPVTVPPTTTALATPGHVVLVDRAQGAIWRFAKADFAVVQNLVDVPPMVTMSAEGDVSISRTGDLVVFDPMLGELVSLERAATEIVRNEIDDVETASLVGTTFAGGRSVVAFGDGRLLLDGDSMIDTGLDLATVQQPGVDPDRVLAVTTSGDAVIIELADGSHRIVQPLGTVPAIRPIWHGGCVHAITQDAAAEYHFCGVTRSLPGAGAEIKLTLVNDWVWVNDVAQGDIWFVREDELELEQISDWSAALNLSDSEDASDDVGGNDEELVNTADAEELVDDVDELDDDEQNTAPVAEDDEAFTRRGRPVVVDVLSNDTDEDNDPLSVESLDGVDADGRTADGALVSLTADGRAIHVVTTADHVGTISFGYQVHDGRQGRDAADVVVIVNEFDEASNRPPVTVDDNATVRAGASVALNVLTNDRDPDGDVLVLTSVEQATGAVNFTPNGEVVFRPDVTSAEGTVLINYVVADDYGAEAAGLTHIRVRRADSNQQPEARNDVGRTTVGRPVILNVLDNDVDPDGDPLVAQNLQSLDGAATTAQVTPDGAFLFTPEAPGSYRFTYTVSDGPEVDQAQIRVDAEARTENRPPVAVVDHVALAIGESRLVRVLDNDGDPDGDIVGVVDWVGVDGLDIVQVPGVGFTVTATPIAESRSKFQYWISDGQSPPVLGTVVVSVVEREPVDYPPIAREDTVDVRPGQTAAIQVLRNDYDPKVGYSPIAEPVASISEGLVRVTQDRQVILLTTDAEQRFSYQFGYDVEDPAGNHASAVVNVRIVDGNQPNRAPVAAADVARTAFESPVVVPVLANDFDPDGDPVTIESIAEQPRNGTVTVLDDGNIVYTPARGFSGTDSFVYTLVDGYSAPADSELPDDQSGPRRDLGQVFVGVMPDPAANRSPIAVDDVSFPEVRIGGELVTLDVLANDSDPDDDPVVVTEVSTAAVGAAAVAESGGSIVYTPPASGDARQVSFAYSIADGRGGVATARVVLELAVDPATITPVAVDDTVGPVRAGSVVSFDPRENDIDPDGDSAELTVLPESDLITVATDGGVEILVPVETTDVAYSVRDPQGLESELGFITVLVVENEPPTVEPISVETAFNQPLQIDIHDAVADPDNDALVITLGSNRSGGSVAVLGQPAESFLQVVFTPDTDFEGIASFDFTVDDLNGHTVSGAASVNVLPPENRPPELLPIVVEAEAGTPSIVRLPNSVTDLDPLGTEAHQFSISGPSQGVVSLSGPNAAGEVTISSAVDSGGQSDNFTYTVVDGEFTVSAAVSIDLAVPTFAAPTLGTDTAETLQGEATSVIELLANDVDNSPAGLVGDGLLVTSVGVTDAGNVAQVGNAVVFTPNADFFGQATFTYTVQDGRRSIEGESVGVVEIDVIGRPDVPQPPTIDSVGDRYLIVTWAAPQGDAARAPVTGYVLQFVAANGEADSITFRQPTTSYRWEGLTNAVEYCFQVAAVSRAGQGEFSDTAGSAECGIPDVRPEAPAAPTVDFDDGQLTVNWAEPLNNGSPITNYQVRISGGLQELSAELGVTSTHTWTGLTNGTDYTFEVRAQNDSVENDGWSEWSGFSEPEHPLTLPDAPAQPVAQRGDRQVGITWQAPDDGGDAISLYQVRSSLGGAWVDVTPEGATNTHTWESIPNGTDVSFQVRAINRDPSSTTPGNVSPVSDVVRTCSVPDAPTRPTVERSDREAIVRWSAPGDQGCTITGYRITSNEGAVQTASAGASSHPFTGLTNGQTYSFTVTAINEVVTQDGRDPLASPASPDVIPAGPPLVSNVTAADNTGVRQIRVQWSAADPNGRTITRYQLQVNSGAWFDMGTTGTSYTYSAASDGTAYSFRVQAVNEIGASVQTGAQRSQTTWTTPGAPNVSASAGSSSAINSSWNTPSSGGTSINGHQWWIGTSGCPSSGSNASGNSRTWTGLSASTTYRVCIRYRNAVGWGSWGSDTGRTNAPPASVNFFWGGSAEGQPGCSSSRCKYMRADGINFTPNRSYTVQCQENASGSWTTWWSGTRTASGSGRVEFRDVCYFGFNTHSARIVIGGVASNSMSA